MAAVALRPWQAAARTAYHERAPRDFLAVATPGAGKTAYALAIAQDLLDARIVERITVVCPTEHLKRQWADAAARVGINLDPTFSNSSVSHAAGSQGVAVTYAQVGLAPHLFAGRTRARRTLVVLDEVHHAGDARTWGDGVAEAFEDATRRLALTGTPFRTDTSRIPFVDYVEAPDGTHRSRADYVYGYPDALADGVVRPVLFLAYSGSMRWRTRAGDEVAARLGEPLTQDVTNQALRTALDPDGRWIPEVLAAADTRLTEVRRSVPDAGGLVIATDTTTARAYARTLATISGEKPVVVLSDESGASERIESFAAGRARWMVAVRMVSEGVDVPRLSVGVYATTTATPLFFAQAVGRFVRSRRPGETASVFVPSVPRLLTFAAEIEVQRDHVLGRPRDDGAYPEDAELAAAQRAERASAEELAVPFEALDSDAAFDRAVIDGAEYAQVGGGDTDSEQFFLSFPGLAEPHEVGAHLRSAGARPPVAEATEAPRPAEPDHRQLMSLRRELNTLVGAYVRRSGSPHAAVHAELRRHCGGPPVPQADADQIRDRVRTVRDWLVRG
jgi:superfamily II DNA or RNA helicase